MTEVVLYTGAILGSVRWYPWNDSCGAGSVDVVMSAYVWKCRVLVYECQDDIENRNRKGNANADVM